MFPSSLLLCKNLTFLLPFNSRRGLAGDVVDHAVDAFDLVYEAGGDLIQGFVRDPGPVGCHEIGGGHGAEGQGIVVGSAVAHDAYGTGVGEHGKILVYGFIQPGGGDPLPEDGVGVPQGIRFFLSDLADDANGEAWPGKGLTHHEIFGEAQLPAQLTHLVL